MAKREVKFESQDRRIAQINKVLNSYGIASIEEAEAICDAKGIDPYLECEQTQNICFENAKWAYVVGVHPQQLRCRPANLYAAPAP